MGQTSTRSRRAAGIIAILGAAVVIALVWRWRAGPAVPAVRTAPVADLLTFLSADDGFQELPEPEQDRVFDELMVRFREDAAHRELKQRLDIATDEDIRRLQLRFFEPVALRRVVGQARTFRGLPAGERYAFLQNASDQAHEMKAWLRGNGDPARDVSARLGSGMASRSAVEWMQYLNERFNDSDREAVMSFVNALDKFEEQRRKRG